MAPHHSSKEEPDPENSFNNFDNASTAGIMTAPQGQVRNRCKRWTALLCSTVGVVCILVSYVICGAIVFSNIEGNSYSKEIKQKEDNEVVSLGVQEQHQLRVAKAVRQQTVEKLWEITEKLNILYKDNWTALAEREMVKFQMELFTQTQKAEGSAVTGTGSQTRDGAAFGSAATASKPASSSIVQVLDTHNDSEDMAKKHEQWSFASSFLYSLTLITTVGNSKKVPESPAGKIVAIVVVSLGLPLLLIYLSVTGAGLAKLVKKLYTIMCCCKNKNITENLAMSHRNNGSTGSSQGTSNTAKSSAIGSGKNYQNSKQQQIQIQQYLQQCRNCHQKSKVHISDSVPGSVKIPMWICFLMLLCYITTGATVFCVYQEKWSFVDAFFFAFSVLWTIGLQAENTDQQQTDGLFVIICTLYLLIGLAILAMCFQLAYDTSTHCLSFHRRLSTCLHLNTEPRTEPMNSSWVYNEPPS